MLRSKHINLSRQHVKDAHLDADPAPHMMGARESCGGSQVRQGVRCSIVIQMTGQEVRTIDAAMGPVCSPPLSLRLVDLDV